MDDLRWSDVHVRVEQLEAETGRLLFRAALAGCLNGLVLIGILCWLTWPDKELAAGKLVANTVIADSFTTRNATLRQDGLLVVDDADTGAVSLSIASSDGPTLSLEREKYGRIVASVGDAPIVGLYGGSSMDPARDRPQIELSVNAEDHSPRIVLRDVHGQVIWHAP
jgi:hypothetical protein